MARGIHGLPKVSPGLAMPNPKTFMAVSGVVRTQGGRPAAVFYPLGYPTLYGPGRDFHDGRRPKFVNFAIEYFSGVCHGQANHVKK
jgi:hypothetical protein